MIGGLIIVGDTTQNVLVRALGPSLPVDGKFADPTLELVDANGDTSRPTTTGVTPDRLKLKRRASR